MRTGAGGCSSSGACGAGSVQGASCSGGSSSVTGSGPVAFRHGAHEHRVTPSVLRAMRASSKLVAQLLAGVDPAGSCGHVSVPAVPRFSAEACMWVWRCLAAWATGGGQLPVGFPATQAAQLWVAADFLQVDALQVACEDALAAAMQLHGAPALLQSLDLCAAHPLGAGRLLRLACQEVMAALHAATSTASSTGSSAGASASGTPLPAAGASGSCPAAAAPGGAGRGAGDAGLLAAAVAPHAQLLCSCLAEDLRERLVSMVTLDTGLDADAPDVAVD